MPDCRVTSQGPVRPGSPESGALRPRSPGSCIKLSLSLHSPTSQHGQPASSRPERACLQTRGISPSLPGMASGSGPAPCCAEQPPLDLLPSLHPLQLSPPGQGSRALPTALVKPLREGLRLPCHPVHTPPREAGCVVLPLGVSHPRIKGVTYHQPLRTWRSRTKVACHSAPICTAKVNDIESAKSQRGCGELDLPSRAAGKVTGTATLEKR